MNTSVAGQLYQKDNEPPTHIYGVSRAEIPQNWGFVEGLVEEACNSSGLYWPSEIYAELLAGSYQLWLAWNKDGIRACMVTTVEQSQRAKWVRGILCAGENPADWVPHIEFIEAWAKAQGATYSHMMGRPGFEKWLRPKGYRRTHALMEKRL